MPRLLEVTKRVKTLFLAKLGRCTRCMRLSLEGAITGWITVTILRLCLSESLVWWIVLAWPLAFTGWWFLHVVRYATWTAVRASHQKRSVSLAAHGSSPAGPIMGAPIKRRDVAVLLAKGATLAMLVSLPLPLLRAAGCTQLPVNCSKNSDCTCSGCCGQLGEGGPTVCQPTC
jgi:hypothetical protein